MPTQKEELQVYEDFLRESLVKYTRRAFQALPKMKNLRILDISCGSGVPTMELAKLSDGEIIGIDTNQTKLGKLGSKIKKRGLTARVKAVNCSMLNMDFPDASFDIIWAEGSIAVIGFEKGLTEWRRLLKAGGFLVVHDELGDLTEKRRQISQCGYNLINYFVLGEGVWWNAYYAPLEEKLDEVRAKHTSDRRFFTVLSDRQCEMDMLKQDPTSYRSVFFIMRKKLMRAHFLGNGVSNGKGKAKI